MRYQTQESQECKKVCVLCVSVSFDNAACPLCDPLLPVFYSGGKAAPQMICSILVGALPIPIPNSSILSFFRKKRSLWVRRMYRRRSAIYVSAVLAAAPKVAHLNRDLKPGPSD